MRGWPAGREERRGRRGGEGRHRRGRALGCEETMILDHSAYKDLYFKILLPIFLRTHRPYARRARVRAICNERSRLGLVAATSVFVPGLRTQSS